jgi:hypothetical protein
MRIRATGQMARCARWLGFDRNPLRRQADRIEAAVRLTIAILVVVVMPIAAIVAGRQADHLALRHAQAQRAAEHLVKAVLLAPAQATGVPDPYTSIQLTWTPARWQPPGQPVRSGEILVPAGTRKGSVVPIWINASGAVTQPPLAHRDIIGDVFLAVGVTCMASLLLLLTLWALARRALNRWRLNAWETEWRSAGPLWSGHRH